MVTATTDLGDIAQALLDRVAQLEQRITSPYYTVPNGSNPTFPNINIGEWRNNTPTVPINQTINTPTNVAATPGAVLDDVYIDVTWMAPSDASAVQYQVTLVESNGAGGWNLDGTYTTTGTTIHLSGLKPNTLYGVSVAGISRIGVVSLPFPAGGYVTVTTGHDTTLPAAPTNVVATAGMTSAMVTWNENTEADVAKGNGWYEVDWGTDPSFTTKQTVRAGSSIASFTGLSAGTAYYFRVRAFDSSGNPGPYTTTPPVTPGTGGGSAPPSDGSAPASSPTPAVTGGVGFLYAKWGAISNTDPVSYDVHVSATSGFTPSSATLVTNTTATSVFLRTLANGTPFAYNTTYYIKIVALDHDGAAAPGGQASGTVANVGSGDIGFKIGGGNLLPNSSFEMSTAGWASASTPAATLTRSNAVPGFHGSWCLAITAAGAGNPNAYNLITPVVGQTYTGSVYVRSSVSRQINLQVSWYNSAFALISTTTVSLAASSTTAWTRIVNPSNLAPAGSVYCLMLVTAIGAAAGEVHYIDAAQIEMGDVVTAYAPKPDEILPGTITAESGIIATLDAGVITTGYIDANRFRAGSITTGVLNVTAGGDNLQPRSRPTLNSTGGMYAQGGATVTVTDGNGEYYVPGQPCWKVVAPGGGSAYVGAVANDSVPVVPNTTYTVSISIFMSQPMQLQLRCTTMTRSGVYIGEPAKAYYGADITPNVWVRLKYTFTTPSNCELIQFSTQWPYDSIPTGTMTYYLYGIQVERGDLATSYKPNAAEVLPGTIMANMILANQISTSHITTDGLDAGVIKFNTMSGDRIAAHTLDATAIKSSSITSATITISSGGQLVAGGTYNGVLLNENGLYGYHNGVNNFAIDNAGNLFFNGNISGSTGTFNGTMSANGLNGGTITGVNILTRQVNPPAGTQGTYWEMNTTASNYLYGHYTGENATGYVSMAVNGSGGYQQGYMYLVAPGYGGNGQQTNIQLYSNGQGGQVGGIYLIVDNTTYCWMHGGSSPGSYFQQPIYATAATNAMYVGGQGTWAAINLGGYSTNDVQLAVKVSSGQFFSGGGSGWGVLRAPAGAAIQIGTQDNVNAYTAFFSLSAVPVMGNYNSNSAIAFVGSQVNVVNTTGSFINLKAANVAVTSTLESKHDISPLPKGWAAEVIKSAPAYRWKYIPAEFSKHLDDFGAGKVYTADDPHEQWHFSPMWEDLHDDVRAVNEDMDLRDMIGVLWAAFSEMDDRLAQLETV